jgi:hypothetical protein
MIFLACKRNYRDGTAAKNYEKIREKLTLREPEPEVDTNDYGEGSGIGSGFLGSIIGAFVVLFVGFSLIGPITETINTSIQETNVSSSQFQNLIPIAGMVPLFFTIVILTIVISTIFISIRNTGLC